MSPAVSPATTGCMMADIAVWRDPLLVAELQCANASLDFSLEGLGRLRQGKAVLLGLSGCEVRHADEKDEKRASNSYF
jgi:hypothetical protein